MAPNLDAWHLSDHPERLGPAPLLRLAAACIALFALAHGGQTRAAGDEVGPPTVTAATTAGHGQKLQAEVHRLIGRAVCRTDGHCRTLPLGVRACGGPEVYLAWSVLGTDEAALRRAAQRYGQWQAQEQARRSTMSICMVELDPGAVCSKETVAGAQTPGRCVLGTGGEAGASR